MPWKDGHYCVPEPHVRRPWDAATPSHVLVHQRLTWIYGTDEAIPAPDRSRLNQLYEAAKHQLDVDAAWEIVRDAIREPVHEALINGVLASADVTRLRVVMPHPAFEEGVNEGDPVLGPTNALPFVYGNFLAEKLGCEVDSSIKQVARIGRTDLNRFERFLWQPSFQGDVFRGYSYIIADDVLTAGATFAALRSHIVSNGGTVCAVTALGHRDGTHQRFPLTAATLGELESLYGVGLRSYWEQAIGHDVGSLTEAEGAFLADWGRQRGRDEGLDPGEPLLHRLRTRLDSAASNASQ